jgi:hypothetical protein
VAVEDRKAEADGLSVGDTLTMTFARTGPVELTIRALIDRPPPGFDGVVYVVNLDTYEANVTDQFDRQVFIELADGISPTQATAGPRTPSCADGPTASCRIRLRSRESVASEIGHHLN